MFTKKKISLFLLTLGVILFVAGLFYSIDPALEGTGVVVWLFVASTIMIGIGCYLTGLLRARAGTNSFTLDFTRNETYEKHQ